MPRRSASSLYAQAFQPALTKAFPVSHEIPAPMRAILAQLEGGGPIANAPKARRDALSELADQEARRTDSAARSRS